MIIKSKDDKLKIAYTFSLALLPLLYLYRIPLPGISSVMGLGEFLIGILFIYAVISGRIIIRLKKDVFTFFCIYTILVSIFDSFYPWFDGKDCVAGVFRLLFYWIIFENSGSIIDKDLFVDIYIKSTVIFSAYLLIQAASYYMFGIKLPSCISQDWMFEIPTPTEEYLRWFFRGRSVFNEPSYFCFYVAPHIVIQGLKSKKLKMAEWIGMMVVTVSIFMSTGVSGLLLAFISWAGVLYYQIKGAYMKLRLEYLGIIFVGVCGLLVFFSSSLTSLTVGRLFSGSSASIRITRAFIVAKQMDLQKLITGVGLNQDSSFQKFYYIKTIYDEVPFFTLQSSFFSILVQTGILGWIIFILWFVNMAFKSKTNSARLIVILLFTVSVYEKTMFSYRMGFYLILWFVTNYSMKKEERARGSVCDNTIIK